MRPLAPAAPLLSEAPHFADAPAPALRVGQLVRVVALGVVLWYLAAVVIRLGLPAGLYGGRAGALLFAGTIPLAWACVWLVTRVGALRPAQVLPGVALACVAAMLCDGVALTWTPGVYGGASVRLALGAAWLLHGVGVILLAALLAPPARR
jgi:hypothetical protein